MARSELGVRVNPGQLDCPIFIEDYITEKDGIAKTQVWKSISGTDPIWAQWIGIHGKEAFVANQTLSADRATLRIRYNPLVSVRCRVIKDNDVLNPYKIISVDDVRNNHQYMELRIERREKS